jgi:hypothetical protein
MYKPKHASGKVRWPYINADQAAYLATSEHTGPMDAVTSLEHVRDCPDCLYNMSKWQRER